MTTSATLSPSAFEPLLPTRASARLAEKARGVVLRSVALTSAAHPTTMDSLRDLLREMNSYYSNRIEGHSTHPLDIAAGLRSDFSGVASTARLQRLAVAHIQAEQQLEGPDTQAVLTIQFLRTAHQQLYARLPFEDQLTADGTQLTPGEFRTMRVVVGRHVPPDPVSLGDFARRFDRQYGRSYSLDDTLVTIAAAHHRASWVHPFEDGNGRAVRLQTHCALFPVTHGIWSISRGLARRKDDYFRLLAEADRGRAGDHDGRGNLSESALASWCEWFIDCCNDQVNFMGTMLRLDDVQRRITGLITARAAQDNRYRSETSTALFHLFATGPMPRGEFMKMTGLGERTARAAVSHLIRVGLVRSASHRAPLQIAFPLDALLFLFPDLYPEAETTRSPGGSTNQ
jgi:Fic family protein